MGYDYTYNSYAIDPPPHVLLGDPQELLDWIEAKRIGLMNYFDTIPLGVPQTVRDGGFSPLHGGAYEYAWLICEHPTGTPWPPYFTVGGCIGRPYECDPDKPLVIALHGYEETHRGDPPYKPFTEDRWFSQFVREGYTVLAPSHLLFTQLAGFYSNNHHAVWTRYISMFIDKVLAGSWVPPHNGIVVVGLSSGGIAVPYLMAYRPDIKAGVAAACVGPLEYYRRVYGPIYGVNPWDNNRVNAYSTYGILAMDRKIQFQLGKADGIYPGGPAISGTGRPVLMSEVFGNLAVMEKAAERLGGSVELHIHEGAHVVDVEAAIEFIS